MKIDARDCAAGLFFVLTGLFFVLNAWTTLSIGTAFRMGPGYFPILLGSVLALLGAVIALRAIGRSREPVGPISWRGIVLITLAPVFFGLTVQGLGLLPSLALMIFISALSSRLVGPLRALVITLVLTALCIGIFHFGLGLPIRLFGDWLGG